MLFGKFDYACEVHGMTQLSRVLMGENQLGLFESTGGSHISHHASENEIRFCLCASICDKPYDNMIARRSERSWPIGGESHNDASENAYPHFLPSRIFIGIPDFEKKETLDF